MKNKCILYKLNRKKSIYSILEIRDEAQSEKYDFSSNYFFKYMLKHNKNAEELDSIPDGEDPKKYRHIINYARGSGWLKKAQKKLHRFLVKKEGCPHYLHSTFRGKSYATNGLEHTGEPRYMFCLDLSNFFSQIKIDKVAKTLKSFLEIDSDVALFYARLCTAPYEQGSSELVLAQGLPTSPVLAYLSNKSLFDYINDCSEKLGITFTLYVDDMVFSSKEKIPQEFIDKLFGILQSDKYGNNLKINKKKVHNYGIDDNKKVTGVVIKDGKPKIPGKKHYELFCYYKSIVSMIHDDFYNIESFIELYNLFMKFMGNLLYLYQVEYEQKEEAILNSKHSKMYQLYLDLMDCVKPGVTKINSHEPYSVSNVDKENLNRLGDYYTSYLMIIKKLRNKYEIVK